jgi:hypothetical protein
LPHRAAREGAARRLDVHGAPQPRLGPRRVRPTEQPGRARVHAAHLQLRVPARR